MSDAGASFDAGWLALREPVDHRSRAASLVPPLRRRWERDGWRSVVDLGSGTGSTLRWLRPRLPGPQRWILVDRDEALLRRAGRLPEPPPGGGKPREMPEVRVESRVADLAAGGLEAVAEADLVTASALLDLVGEGWMRRWVAACRRAGCGVYVALSYDGTVRWDGDPDPDDGLALEAVNEHQRSDKGTGAALGPSATDAAVRLFEGAGYRTWTAPSPWVLGPGDEALAGRLLDGWAEAARDARPGAAERIAAWARRRRETLASGCFRLVVGHRDLLALPADPADPGPAPGGSR